MNRNLIYTAVPFAAFFDIALVVKAFYGYSDPTLAVLMWASLAITVVLVLRATGNFHLPTFTSTPEVREVHHYHSDECDRPHCDEACGDDRYDEGHETGYDEGYEQGKHDGDRYDEGYEAGYGDRKEEEVQEAETLAKTIVDLLKKKEEAPPVQTEQINHDGNA
jgi:hypothetical protein